MAQVKIFALRESLADERAAISDAVHAAVVEALTFPPEKRFHRFFPMEREDFLFPAEKSPRYLILEISLMEGRSATTKKRLIHLLFQNLEEKCGLAPGDLEIQLLESPKGNWGFRGQTGEEIALGYRVEV